jgi:polysaccharide biosynthesis transport protein
MKHKSVFKINDLIMYLAVAVEHARLMVLILCLSLLTGLTYYCFARPVYYSRSLVKVEITPQVMDNNLFHDGTKGSVQKILESTHLIELTAKKLGVNANAKEIELRYLKKIDIRPIFEGFQIEVWPYDYKWARDFPEALVREYKEYMGIRRVQMVQDTIATFNADMDTLKKKTDFDTLTRHTYLDAARAFEGVRAIPGELQFIKTRLDRMDFIRQQCNSTTDPVTKLTYMSRLPDPSGSRYRDLEPHLGTTIAPEDSVNGSDIILLPHDLPKTSSNWLQLDRDAHNLQQEIAKKSEKYLPGHPEIRERVKKLKLINDQLEAEFNNQLRNFNLEYETLVTQQQHLEGRQKEYDDKFTAKEKAASDYDLDRTGSANIKHVMDQMNRRLSLIDLNENKERISMDYIGPLEAIKTEPKSPNRMRITLMSIAIGLALAVAIPFALAYLDNSIGDIEQAEEELGLRGLGVVPRVDENAISNILISGTQHKPTAKPEYHLLENFRIIRTNLIMNSQDPNLPQVILITSAMPQEGKTMIAANLAMSFASKGEKTLLIDGDLRRGRLHRMFGVQNKPGLSDVLSKYNTLADAMRPTGSENLTLMTCGKHLNWAAELLDSNGFAKIVQDLRSQYQRIIIDTPPVLGLSETSIMQRHADGVVMVIWSNNTQLPNVKDSILALQTNGAKFCGFILNRLDFSAFANRYKYFYYSPRYYSNYKAIEATTAGVEG